MREGPLLRAGNGKAKKCVLQQHHDANMCFLQNGLPDFTAGPLKLNCR